MAAPSENPARLRLAARMLIELRTPRNAPNYLQILADLVNSHPAEPFFDARRLPIELDDQGTLLWYLSETLLANPQDYQMLYPRKRILSDAYEALIQASITETSSKQQLWPNGPSKRRVADAIRSAFLETQGLSWQPGLWALIALEIPCPESRLIDAIGDLLVNQKEVSNLLQTIGTQVRVGYWFLISMSTTILIAALARLFVHGTTFVTTSIAVAALLISSISSAMLIHFRGVAKRNLASFFSSRALMTLLESRRPKLHSVSKDHAMTIPPILRRLSPDLYRSLSHKTGYMRGILASMLRHPDSHWGLLGLTATTEATPAIVTEVMHVLRLPETPRVLRAQIFRWLCNVNRVSVPKFRVVSFQIDE